MLLYLKYLQNNSFIVIVTNHCGNDVYRFDKPVKPYSGEFYLRQIIGSVNFDAGTDTRFLTWILKLSNRTSSIPTNEYVVIKKSNARS